MFMSLYYKISTLLVALVMWFGFIGPYCVSSKSNELVLGWYGVTILLFPVVIATGIKMFKSFIERLSNEN